MTVSAQVSASHRRDLAPGTPVWCVAGGITAGGRVSWDAGPWARAVSLCVLGAHFPRQVPVEDLEELDADTAPSLGLCPECLGYGTGEDLPHAATIPVGDAPAPCVTCGGTGRSCMRLILAGEVLRTGAPVVALLPHGARRLDGCTPGVCVSCGLPVSDPQAHPAASRG
jgi:hypothetical protein